MLLVSESAIMPAGRLARRLNSARIRTIIRGAMRAGANPSRILLALLSCAALLAGSLVPCPPRAGAERAEHAAVAEHPPGCEMHESSPSVSAACPCGCGERVPMAGSAARLGVALPSAPPIFEPPSLAAHPPIAAALLESCFAPAIDHVPLPA
jgi:hypothetical protein